MQVSTSSSGRPAGRGVAHVVGGDERDAEVPRDVDQRAVEALLVRVEVALEVDVEAVGEEALQAREQPSRRLLGCSVRRESAFPQQRNDVTT